MLAWKSGLRFFVSAPEVLFFVTWKRALLAKVPVFRCQKMALRVPRQKNRDHFLMPTSPQNDVQHVCFMHLSLLGGFWANLKKLAFWARFPPLNDQIGKKSTYIGRNGPRAKTKTVMKPVKQWEKLGSMPNLKFKTFLNKNPPTIVCCPSFPHTIQIYNCLPPTARPCSEDFRIRDLTFGLAPASIQEYCLAKLQSYMLH